MTDTTGNPQAALPAAPAPLPYTTAPPVQPGAAPMFYSMPQPSSSGGNIRKRYKVACVKGLCITILVFGNICFLAQVVNIGLETQVSFTGGGIFGAFFYILTASIGLYSVKSRTTCPIVAFLVLAILSAIVSIFPVIVGSADIGSNLERRYVYDYYDDDWYDGSHGRNGRWEPMEQYEAKIAMGAIMIVMAAGSAVLLIIASAFACHGLCPDSSHSGAMVIPDKVHYVPGPNGQQQMLILPLGGQPQPLPPGTVLPYSQIWTSQPGAIAGASAPVHPPEYGRQPSPPPQYKAKEQLPSVD